MATKSKKQGKVKVGKLSKSPQKLTARQQKNIKGGKTTLGGANWGQTIGGANRG